MCLGFRDNFKFFFRVFFLFLSSPSLIKVRNKSEPLIKKTNKKEHTDVKNHLKKDASTYGNCLTWTGCVEKFRAIYKNMHKKIAPWCALVYYKLQEIYQRCKALWKSKMPSVKVHWITYIYEPNSLQYPVSRGFFLASLLACKPIARNTRDANDFVHAKRLARKKPLLAG